MNMEKLTKRSREALMGAHNVAVELNHQEIKPLHLLKALLEQENGLVSSLVKKIGAVPETLLSETDRELGSIPAVTGSGVGQLYNSRDFSQVMVGAAKEAEKMKDEYVSVEHLLMGIINTGGKAAAILKNSGVNIDTILDSLKAVRGNQRITSEDPESTFEALEKYGRDLTQMAAQDKLDPVIGRDDEIRRVIQILSRRTKKQSGFDR